MIPQSFRGMSRAGFNPQLLGILQGASQMRQRSLPSNVLRHGANRGMGAGLLYDRMRGNFGQPTQAGQDLSGRFAPDEQARPGFGPGNLNIGGNLPYGGVGMAGLPSTVVGGAPAQSPEPLDLLRAALMGSLLRNALGRGKGRL